MSDEDARSLPAAAQAALGTRAVRAVLGGMTQAQAARVFGVHPNAVNRWIRRYREGGFPGLSARRRGRRAGEQAALTEPQQQEVIALVREATPDQLGLPGFLWTREAVGELIARRDGVRLARTTMGAYLRGWGFSPHKPQHRALEQDPAAVARWLAEDYPAICAQAKREGGVVLWLDEMGHADRIELHFLPGYSPELNPVEQLNQDVKANAAGRRRARSAAELAKELRS
jgi:transposase